MNVDRGVAAAIGAVRALSLSIGIPQRLHEIGVKREDIPALAEAAFNDVCTGGNPRPVGPRDPRLCMKQLVTTAMEILIGLLIIASNT